MENKYITLEIEGLTFQAKLESEGVVLDVFDKDDESIATTYKFYDDLDVEVKHLA